VNKTGVQGAYDILLSFAPDDAPNSNLPSLFIALRQRLGLQLVSRNAPVETVVNRSRGEGSRRELMATSQRG
jgi:uncharacterized protein (TIGR03435 family)